ncbi:hypothetical protein ATCC90586_010134 [Pythium insidiosum]|nr:hypothetical protein ATCC90586_010134 [Pythium insidiosum]
MEEQRREGRARLRLVVSALRDAGAATNGFDSAYDLEPPPRDYAQLSLHERFFRRRVVMVDERVLERRKERSFAFDPPDRARLEWQLSALGREKCEELFRIFDLDADDAWSYEEFLEYMTAIEFMSGVAHPEMHAFADDPEMWRLFMTDHYEMDALHCLTLDGFAQYRQDIEDEHPLAHDLWLFGISMNWQSLRLNREVRDCFGEYADEDETVSLRKLQFLLLECGRLATYQDVWQAVRQQRLFFRCHRQILMLKKALRLFGYRQKSTLQLTTPELEEDPRICRPGFLSLVLSRWESPELTPWRRFFLKARLQPYRWLRVAKRRVSYLFSWIRRVARTGLLRSNCLQSTAERERGDDVFKLEIGPNFTTHATIHLAYYSDADSAATLHELKYLERGAECFLFVDLLCRSGTREAEAQLLAQRITWFIETYFREHLELLPFFAKWFVTVPTKIQLRSSGGGANVSSGSASISAPVVRLVLLFTGEMDLYEVLQSLKLPSSMQFDHILQRFTMRWLFSHSLEEILTNKRLVLGSQWSCGLALEWKQLTDSFRSEFAGSSFVISALAANTAPTTGIGTLSRGFSRVTSRSSLQGPDDVPRLNTGGFTASFPFATPLPTSGLVGTFRESARIGPSVFPSSRMSTRDGDDGGDSLEEAGSRLENELLEFYELCVKTLSSIHTIRAEAGTSGVTCVTEGLNAPRACNMTAIMGQLTARAVLLSEIQSVLSLARRRFGYAVVHQSPKDKDGDDEDEERRAIFHSFAMLRARLLRCEALAELNPIAVLRPFLDLIRHEHSSSTLTGAALEAVQHFLQSWDWHVVTSTSSTTLSDVLSEIVDAVTLCRFQETNSESDQNQYCKETSSKALPHAQFKLALHEQLISLTAEDLLERGGTPPASRTSSPRSSASAVTDHHLEFAGDKSASGRPRYRVCKVCSLLHDDPSKTIGKSRAYCIECSSEKARVYLCDRIRTTETGNQMTCFQIWHQYLSHGKARDGARKIRLRASQNACLA